MTLTKRTSQNYYTFLAYIGSVALVLSSCSKETALNPNVSSTSINAAKLSSRATALSAAESISGVAIREEWDNIIGNDVIQIPTSTEPTSTSQVTSLEEQQNDNTANVGSRIRAYITAPQTGNYIFWISGDDAAELWLSTDEDPANKVKIAYTLSWTNFRQWDKFNSQKSATVSLNANTKYYIEVLHKQGAGGNNLSVQWQLPDNSIETPIGGSRLSTYVPAASASSSTSGYTVSPVINLIGAHDMTISGEAISGGTVPDITLTNCYNIRITGNKLYNSTDVGIHLYNCKNITVDNNFFTNVSTGVYAEKAWSGGIKVTNNQFLNMKGPFPRGQFVQFNNVYGPGNAVSNNVGENVFGQSFPEDAINMYESSGTSYSPIIIDGNWIRGGGPSSSGGGIMLGDNGGSYLVASNNVLVNPGEYGMAIAGGDHNSIINNTIYGTAQFFTNVGLYVNSINGHRVTNATVTGNQINFFNSANYSNSWWLSSNADKPYGWDGPTNTLGANINGSILPSVIITMH